MSLPELEALVDADTWSLIEEAGSVDAAITKMRQFAGEEAAAEFAAWADRYR
jgi:hypothetical protein